MLLVDCDSFSTKQWLDEDCLSHTEQLFDGPMPPSFIPVTPEISQDDSKEEKDDPWLSADTDTEDNDGVLAVSYYFFSKHGKCRRNVSELEKTRAETCFSKAG